MSVEFNPIAGRADIISSMAESREGEKPGKKAEKSGKPSPEQSKSHADVTSGMFGKIFEDLGRRSREQGRLSGKFSTTEAQGFRLIPIETLRERAKAEGAEILYESQIPLHSGDGEEINFPVVVERTKDGRLVMNELPDLDLAGGRGYNRETITDTVKGAGVTEKPDLPKSWEKKSKEEKKAYLEKKFGIGTLKVEAVAVVPPDGDDTEADEAELMERSLGGVTTAERISTREPLLSEGRFKNLLFAKHRLVHEGVAMDDPEMIRLTRLINEMRASEDPLVAYFVNEDTKAFIARMPRDGVNATQAIIDRNRRLREAVNLVLDEEARSEIQENWTRINNNFEELSQQGADPALFKRIDEVAQGALSSLMYGSSLERVRGILEQAARDVAGPRSVNEIPGFEGFVAWYTVHQIENLENSFREERRRRISVRPEDNIDAAYDLMSFAEKSGTKDAFSDATRHLYELLKAVESSPKIEEFRKTELREHIEAFTRLTPVFIYMREKSGDLKTLKEALQGIESKTFYWFYHRYSRERVVDLKGEQILKFVDAEGNPVEENLPKINILSEAENILVKEYLTDRFRMNRVEEFTRGDLMEAHGQLGDDILSRDRKWLAVYTYRLSRGEGIDDIHDGNLNEQFDAIAGDVGAINAAWHSEREYKLAAVTKWYQRHTLIGAGDDINPETGEGTERGIELRRRKEDELIESGLRQRLSADMDGKRVSEESIANLISNKQLMDSLSRTAGNLVTYKWSGLDRMRVSQKDIKRRRITVRGQNTPYFIWQKDHPLDFMETEKHGDARVLGVLQQRIDREWSVSREDGEEGRGFVLPQLMTGVRIIQEGGILGGREGGLSDHVKNLRNRAAENHGKFDRDMFGNPREDEEADDRRNEFRSIATATLLFKGIDPTGVVEDEAGLSEIHEIKWDDKSEFLRKDELLVDNAEDSEAGLRFYNGALKKWTFSSYEKEFLEMMNEYYSSRHVRKRPGAEFLIEVYYEVGQHWHDWLGYKENLTDVGMEYAIQKAVESNIIDIRRGNELANRLLGESWDRWQRQMRQLISEIRKGALTPEAALNAFWDLLKTLFKLFVSNSLSFK